MLCRGRPPHQVKGPVDNEGDTKESLRIASVEIDDVDDFGYQPLIDEPVTGSGNDDLWIPDCDPAKEGDCPAPPSSRTSPTPD